MVLARFYGLMRFLSFLVLFVMIQMPLWASRQCHQLIQDAADRLEAARQNGTQDESALAEKIRAKERLESVRSQIWSKEADARTEAYAEHVALTEFERALIAKLGEAQLREVLRSRRTRPETHPVSEGLMASARIGTIEVAAEIRNLLIENYGYVDADLPALNRTSALNRAALERDIRALREEEKSLIEKIRNFERMASRHSLAQVPHKLFELETEYGSEFVFRTAVNLGYVDKYYRREGVPIEETVNLSGPLVLVKSAEDLANLEWAVKAGDLIGTPLTEHELRSLSRSFDRARLAEKSEDDRLEIELREAAQNGDLESFVRFSQKNPAVAYLRDGLNLSPLDYAAANGHLSIVEYLLSDEMLLDANLSKSEILNYETASGRSALSLAILNDRFKVSETLVAQGARLSKNATIELLNELGVFPSPLDRLGNFRFQAVNPAHAFRSKNNNDLNPFTSAALKAAYQFTLKQAVSSGALSKEQLTDWMLRLPIRDKKRPWVVEELITAGADINATDSAGDSLLHIAVKEMNKELVDYLVRLEGIKLSQKNRRGMTPIDEARKLLSSRDRGTDYYKTIREIEALLKPTSLGTRLRSWWSGE